MPVSVSVFCPFFLHGQTIVIGCRLQGVMTQETTIKKFTAMKLKHDVAFSVLPEFWTILYNSCVNLRNGRVYMFLCYF